MNARIVCIALLISIMAGVDRAMAQAQAAAPATPPATNPAAGARGARGRGGLTGPPLTPEDTAEIAKNMDLPTYGPNMADGDYSTGPNYTPAVEETARPGVPQGKIINFVMNSADSKFYPGTPPFTRKVAVYVPAQYVAGSPTPVIVSCDQYGLNYHLSTILDNMIADHRVPSMCAVMIANGGSERSVEYDTVSPKYTEFVEAEVLPRAEKEAGIVITKDPKARMTFGGSSGGICAFTMAWFHPELYGRVLSYSGTFVNLQHSDAVPHGGWEYLEHLIPNNPAKPIRVWIEAAQNDNGGTTGSAGFHNWIIANDRMAKVMKEKGYHYQFVFAKGAGHTDSKAINQTLPDALEFVWKDYQPAK